MDIYYGHIWCYWKLKGAVVLSTDFSSALRQLPECASATAMEEGSALHSADLRNIDVRSVLQSHHNSR